MTNRQARRAAEKAARCIDRGTKVPSGVRYTLGNERLKAIAETRGRAA